MNHLQCAICGTKDALVFHCNYCGGYFCAEHHLPESHNCTNQPKATPHYMRPPEMKSNEPLPKIGKPIPHRSTFSHPKHHSKSKPSFWKFALFKLLRIIGVCSVLFGAFMFLINLGNQNTNAAVLCVFLFIGGVLLSWYAAFKMRTITIERGVRDAGR